MKKLLLLAVLIILCGCVTNLSNLQRRDIELKELEGKFDDAFKATMAVLQDRGYVIKHTDYNAGVIQAETGMKSVFWESYNYTATATIEQFGENRVKERITFVKKMITNMGENNRVEDSVIIYDPAFLQQIYDDIQKEMFIRENLKK